MSGEIAPDLVERCVALVHDLADGKIRTCDYGATRHRAQQIAAELPEPVDPDLIEARRICAKALNAHGGKSVQAEGVLLGNWDTMPAIIDCLATIKDTRTRAISLATQSPATGRAAG